MLAALGASGDPDTRAAAAKRLITLDLLAGDNVAAHKHLEAYQAAGGSGPDASAAPCRGAGSRAADRLHSRTAALVRPHGGDLERPAARRRAGRPRPQRGDQRLPGLPQQRSAGTDRVSEAGASLSLAGPRAREAGRARTRSSRSRPANRRRRRAAQDSRLSHARRLRQRSGARNRERHPRLPHHRFRLPARRAGAGAAHQPAVHATTITRPRVPVLYGAGLLALRQGKGRGRVHRRVSLAIPSLCRLYLGLSKLDPRHGRGAAQGHARASACELTRTCWISSAACSRSATARPWFPAARARRRPGPTWSGVSPDKGAAVLREAARQRRRLAGQLLRRPGAHERSGEGLPHRARRA